MQALKNIGLGILGIGMLVGMAVVALLYLRGIAWVSERVFDYVALVNGYAFIISAFVFLPCAVFRATRKVAAFGLFAASMVFGITVWIFGLLVTYAIWGLFGVFIGLGLFGFGVVPLGMIAGGLHGEWEAVMQLVLGIILTLGARGIAAWLAAKIDEAESFRAAGHQVAPSYCSPMAKPATAFVAGALGLSVVVAALAQRSEIVEVKYRGPVDLKHFDCSDISRSSFIKRVCYDRS